LDESEDDFNHNLFFQDFEAALNHDQITLVFRENPVGLPQDHLVGSQLNLGANESHFLKFKDLKMLSHFYEIVYVFVYFFGLFLPHRHCQMTLHMCHDCQMTHLFHVDVVIVKKWIVNNETTQFLFLESVTTFPLMQKMRFKLLLVSLTLLNVATATMERTL